MADTKSKPTKSKKPNTTKTSTKSVDTSPAIETAESGSAGTTEAKTRFNAALDEAKAGAAALKGEAASRAAAYRDEAKVRSEDWAGDAKKRAGDLAVEAKTKTSDGIASLGKVVSENSTLIDEKLGEKYGDYARSASRSLQETAAKLDSKSVDELSEDARAMVRKSPGAAVGLAAVVGFMFARLFSGGRN